MAEAPVVASAVNTVSGFAVVHWRRMFPSESIDRLMEYCVSVEVLAVKVPPDTVPRCAVANKVLVAPVGTVTVNWKFLVVVVEVVVVPTPGNCKSNWVKSLVNTPCPIL